MDIRYRAHVQNIGWQGFVTNGQVAGTTGQSLRMEAIQILVDNAPAGVGVRYRAHVQNIGWQGWVANGETAGTTGQSLRMEAIQIELTGVNPGDNLNVAYQAHVQNIGWQPLVGNGEEAGTTGLSLRMEAITISIVQVPAPGRYVMSFDQIDISNTRAVHQDTDHASLTIAVNGTVVDNQTRDLGNLNNGIHGVNLQIGPVNVGPNDVFKCIYHVLNKGHGDNTTIDDALARGATAAINTVVRGIISLIDADCDGDVVIDVLTFNGTQLEQLTSSIGSHGEIRPYSFESQVGCGSSPQYTATWHINRV